MIKYNEDSKIYYSTKINDKNYFGGFSTKAQGDGRNVTNITNFLNDQKIGFRQIVTLDQIHSANVEVFAASPDSKIREIKETDGVVTKESQTALTVITADCVPIIFADKKTGVIGISHQGWRGSLKKMVVEMIDKMVEAGSKKENIIVAIGPSIGDCCYDISDDRYDQFLSELEVYTDKIFNIREGKRYLNLTLLNYLLLIDTGVKKENIDFFPFCTKCHEEKFYSARRIKKNDFPRQFSFLLKRA
jgi:hypothetical protein